MALDISEAEVKALTSAIFKRYGLDFTNYEMKSLTRGVKRLMMRKKLDNIMALWSVVLSDPEFFRNSIDVLMVNLTEMFRNPDSWVFLREKIFPVYKDKPILNIWFAGCSTGEEVYTAAIVLNSIGMLTKTRALASDLSEAALETAQIGEYSKMLLKNYRKNFNAVFPGEFLTDHFTEKNNNYRINENLKNYVRYIRHNLVHEDVENSYDIIFCRNVMIYFDENLKMKVIKKFHKAIRGEGFLVIGYYDTMPDAFYEYFEAYDNRTKIYKKKIN